GVTRCRSRSWNGYERSVRAAHAAQRSKRRQRQAAYSAALRARLGRGCTIEVFRMVFRAIYDKIKQGLSKTRGVFSGIASLFRLRGKVDRDFLTELEKRLYLADVGTSATTEIVERVRQAVLATEETGAVEAFVKHELDE